jgi:hypothetical protein
MKNQSPVFRGGAWDGSVFGEDFLYSSSDGSGPPKRLKVPPLIESDEDGQIVLPNSENGKPLWVEPVYELSEDGKEYRFVGNETQELKPSRP